MPDDVAKLVQSFDWATLGYIIALVIAGAILIWAKNAVMRRIQYIRFLADKRLAIGIIVHRSTAVGSEEALIIDIEPGRITAIHEDGRYWIVPPKELFEHGVVIGGPWPQWATEYLRASKEKDDKSIES